MYEALYEIAISIGTSLNLEKMLKRFLSSSIASLDLDGSAIYKIDSKTKEENLTLSLPKSVTEDKEYKRAFEIFTTNRNTSYIELDGVHYYKFNIANYGFNIFIREKPIERDLLVHLPEIYIKLAIAVQSATLNADLQKKVERELSKHRRKDLIMFQQARMTSIAELIGNISHQWRQPLNNISILIQDIRDAHEFDELDTNYIENFITEAMVNIKSMSETIDNFRHFFTGKEEYSDFSVLKVIEDGVQLIKDTFTTNDIQIIFRDFDDFRVFGNRVEFSQVIINILNNAKDVLTDRWISDAKVWISINREEHSISIEDNGGGVSESHISKIFEPYFTTKHQSAGTGIGLYMAKITIERNMHGVLLVQNSNNGANFIMTFPRSKEK